MCVCGESILMHAFGIDAEEHDKRCLRLDCDCPEYRRRNEGSSG
jgi:hypothetical protein